MNNHRFSGTMLPAFILGGLLLLSGCASKSPAPVYGRDNTPKPVEVPARDTYTVKSGDTLYSIAREHGMDHRELIALNRIENPNQISVGRVLRVRPKGSSMSETAATSPVTSDVVVTRPIGGDAVIEARPLGSNTETLKREPKGGKETYSEQALARAQSQEAGRSSESLAPQARSEMRPEAKPEAKPEQKSEPQSKSSEVAASDDDVPWIWPANGKIVATFSDGGNKGVDIAGKAGDPVIAAGEGKVVYSGTGLRGYGKLVIIKHNNTFLSAYAHNQSILVKEGQSVTRGQKIAEMGNSDADQVKLHFEVRRQGKPVDPLKYLPPR